MPLFVDYDLQLPDIQALESHEQVVGLFAALGYNTEARLTQTAEAMGLTGDNLKREIRHIERIADQENGTLQIYLAELRSVTVANTQALARALRSRAGIFLWVLTSDYERLDFVLFEAMAPEAKVTSGLNAKGVSLRPRVLTVNRRDPGPTRLRALRRFSYTEADADYQYDKLRSAYAIAEWAEPYFNNRALFSDYYLKERLPRAPEWAESTATAQALRTFQSLYEEVRQKLQGQLESVARAQLLEPALKALGFVPKVGGRRTPDDYDKPDYALPAGVGTGQTVAYCNAYVWDRNLDGRDEGRDTETPNENPGAVVVSLLEREDAPDWALVTNGKTWRLYSKKAHSRASNYYEIDLEEALASPDPGDAFRYFWLLFRAAAFTRAPAAEGEDKTPESFLDRLLAESALYAKALGERLKDRVFEEIFPEFAEGFIAHIRASEGPQAELDEARLDEVFQGTLAFLYRLLFLLYAEARDLLPVRETREYYEASLTRLKQEIAEHAADILDEAPERLDKAYSVSETSLYQRLGALFAVIDAGDADRNVPLYNGGLFLTQPAAEDTTPEARNARFLAAQAIPDRYLARGLDRLARDIDDKTQALAFIDYKSLGVRQLGSIYEGLLEFKVRVAEAKLAVVKGKKTDEVVSYRQAEADGLRIKVTLRKGQVYLENDRRERKATGSYYTPDYIVKYIVKNTVGPVLAEKCEALRPKLREAQKAHREAIKRHEAFQKQGMSGDDPEKVANTFRGVVDELFGLRVLDPAMGSGHFLVEAVDFITDGLLNFLNAFPWNPVTAELRRTRETILAEMERQGVSVDPAKLSDVNLLKRHVLKRCIYGVDLNPMAVELAKVSLWLDCFTLGAPLSFLDHHLKCGNSLVGVWDISQYIIPGSGRWEDVMRALASIVQISQLADSNANEVVLSRHLHAESLHSIGPTKARLNVELAIQFEDLGNISRAAQVAYYPNLPGSGTDSSVQKFERAQAIANLHSFFHWQLEFPEVYIALERGSWKENQGFDAVVGNPPYVRESGNKELFRYVQRAQPYLDYYQGKTDIYFYFTIRGLLLAKDHHPLGYIIPANWLEAVSSTKLRKFLRTQATPKIIVTFGGLPVFEDAAVEPLVLVAERQMEESQLYHQYRTISHHSAKDVIEIPSTIEVPQSKILDDGWHLSSLTTVGLDKICDNITAVGLPLGDSYHVEAGINTGADAVSSRSKEYWPAGVTEGQGIFAVTNAEIASLGLTLTERRQIKTYLPPESVNRYSQENDGDHNLIYLLRDTDLSELPHIRKHLSKFRSILENRAEIKRNPGREWWHLLWPRDQQIYDAPSKIVIANATAGNSFYLDTEQTYYNIGCTVIAPTADSPYDLRYVLALLNSRLLDVWYGVRGQAQSHAQRKYFPDKVRQVPIRKIALRTNDSRRPGLVKEAVGFASNMTELVNVAQFGASALGQWTTMRLSAKPEEADAIHDLLAQLAGEMINLKKQEQAGIKRYLDWLEAAIKVHPGEQPGEQGINALTGKTRMRNYPGDYQKKEVALPFDELMDILHRNRTRLGVSLNDARFVARLKAEYEKSLAVLLPIKERLAFTDKLIDQIVYRLYGLTKDEIAVVEARG